MSNLSIRGLNERREKRIAERHRARLSYCQKKKRGPYKCIGRERNLLETELLEILCERESVDHHEAARITGSPADLTYHYLAKLREQKLARCIKRGRNTPGNCRPSIWQLTETYERNNRR